MDHKEHLFTIPSICTSFTFLLVHLPRFFDFPSSPRLSLLGLTTSPLSPPSPLHQDNSACQSCADTAQLTPKVGEERDTEREAREGGGERESQQRDLQAVSPLCSPDSASYCTPIALCACLPCIPWGGQVDAICQQSYRALFSHST